MARNDINSLSYNVAQANIQRSKFKSLSHPLCTTFNEGDLYPIMCLEVLPGDTFSIKTSSFVRMQTLIAPTFGDCYLDTYYFFVPFRLVWDHWKEFMGENSTGYWTQETEYTVPQIGIPPVGGFAKGTCAAALLGQIVRPVGVDYPTISALPFRGIALVWNEWFRSENLQNPYVVHKDETTRTWDKVKDLNSVELGGTIPKVGKLRDLIVSALPEPQKGKAVELPIGDTAPVLASPTINNLTERIAGEEATIGEGQIRIAEWYNGASGPAWYPVAPGTKRYLLSSGGELVDSATTYTGNNNYPIGIDNLIADLSTATAVTINQLRLAFQTQRLLERDARGGTRYNELIYSHFNVICPDYRVQRSEYLGGSRSNINISPVVQSSESGTTPQGTITGISASGNVHHDFTKSFTEHGMILGFCCVRVKHTYAQGIPKFYSKKNRLDFYWPVLAHIGEQPILNKEIFVSGTGVDDEVFGYQEAWYEYRHALARVSGEFHPDYTDVASPWVFVDKFTEAPSLTGNFIEEDESNINRVVAVQSSEADQFKANFYFDITAVRPMPVHSTPGLIDHF